MTLAYEECLKHPKVNDSRELKPPPSPEHPVYDQLCRGELKVMMIDIELLKNKLLSWMHEEIIFKEVMFHFTLQDH